MSAISDPEDAEMEIEWGAFEELQSKVKDYINKNSKK